MLQKIEQTLRSHPFVTPWYLQNPHIQTFFPKFFPKFKTELPKPEKKFINLPDGSKLIADCWWQKNKEDHQTIVILGGIEGYKREKTSHFAINIVNKAYFFKYNVIHLKHRGEADSLYHTKSIAYDFNDLPIAFEAIKNWGIKKFFVIAYSIGGYLLFFALGQLGKKAKEYILGAVTISTAATNILKTWQHVEKNFLYNRALLNFYKDLIKRRAKIDPPGMWDLKELKSIQTKHQWAEKYLHLWDKDYGFTSLEDLDKKVDAVKMLPKIQVPTLIIYANDDSLMPKIDLSNIDNPNIIKFVTKHGGHGGFFSLKPQYGDLDGHWAQNRAMEFIRLLENKK